MDKVKKVMLDLDGVLVNFVEGINRAFGIKYDYAKLPERMKWNWFSEYLGLDSQEVDSICTINFWAGLRWMHDGKEILELVESIFDDIYLLTTPMPNPESYTGKMLWVERHIPRYKNRTIITTVSKFLFAGENRILIDDKNENIDEFNEAGGRGILVPRPWNRAYDTLTLPQLKTVLKG